MSYTSILYYVLLAVILLAYYIAPDRIKWTVLLAGSLYFYLLLAGSSVLMCAFLAMILVGYVFGILIGKKYREWKKGKSLPKAKSLKDAMNMKNRGKKTESGSGV